MKFKNATDDRSLARRTVVIASLGLAGLLGITVVGTSHFDVAPARDDVVAAPAAKSAAVAGSRRPLRHIRSGQWQADARTFAAVVRYLLDPEIQTKPSGGSPSLLLAMPTNLVSTTPLMRSTS
jgi:hypothetical protein